jgi:hypothetical protein
MARGCLCSSSLLQSIQFCFSFSKNHVCAGKSTGSGYTRISSFLPHNDSKEQGHILHLKPIAHETWGITQIPKWFTTELN